jgi:hypothetical protein
LTVLIQGVDDTTAAADGCNSVHSTKVVRNVARFSHASMLTFKLCLQPDPVQLRRHTDALARSRDDHTMQCNSCLMQGVHGN